MITPNKVVPLANSALGLAWRVLDEAAEAKTLAELHERTSEHFESIDQFILTIDLLFVLGRMDIDFSTGRILHAE